MKLTKKHIPSGYNYAVVDKDGLAWATKKKPTLRRDYDYSGLVNAYWAIGSFNSRLIGKGFDASDWHNSLVSTND